MTKKSQNCKFVLQKKLLPRVKESQNRKYLLQKVTS